jgi:uncharacterized membrane protein YoaK (UPF0700 family)
MPAMTTDTEGRNVTVIAVLLAACAGSADVFALFGLGKAFAGIVTGNLVTAGYGIATGDVALIKPTLTAVVAFFAGALAWAGLLRLPRAALPLLFGEMAILLTILVAWLAVDAHPDGVLTLVLLALASIAMGGQSTWALRIHQTTTYFTGLVAKVAGAVAEGSTNRLSTGIRQLAALLAGAVVSAVVLSELRRAAPAVPVALLGAAIAVQLLAATRS